MTPTIKDVSDFWDSNPCGHETCSSKDRLEYFLGIEKFRYETIPFIKKIGRFEEFSGKDVLEIGCGLGTDGAQFAKNGALYYGVDLTSTALKMAQENFFVRGLAGEFFKVNAEGLPFASATLDHIYSLGVIHHTVDPAAIVNEMWRVIKPGGTFTVMLYNRTSINYYIEIMFLRKIGRELLRPRWAPRLLSAILRLPLNKFERHRQYVLRNPHPTKAEWISMNTDGPDCPIARVYSRREVLTLFNRFKEVHTEVHFFDRSHWPFIGRIISDSLAEMIGRRLGWCRVIQGMK